jgi:hypothetical protein
MARSAGSWFAGTYVVASVLLLPFSCHRATVHGRKLPSILSVNVGEPFGTVIDDAVRLGGGRLDTGVVMVKARVVFDGPDAFETETFALPGNAASWGKIEAVSCPELMNAVARGEPFQFTTDELSKFEPATVSMKPARTLGLESNGLQ